MALKQPPFVHPKNPMTGEGQTSKLAPEPALSPSAHPGVPQTGLKPSKQSPV